MCQRKANINDTAFRLASEAPSSALCFLAITSFIGSEDSLPKRHKIVERIFHLEAWIDVELVQAHANILLSRQASRRQRQ